MCFSWHVFHGSWEVSGVAVVVNRVPCGVLVYLRVCSLWEQWSQYSQRLMLQIHLLANICSSNSHVGCGHGGPTCTVPAEVE